MSALFRRGLLVGTAALLAGAGTTASAGAAVNSAPVANPDAELLAACATFDALERTFQGADPDEWEGFDALGHRTRDAQQPHLEVILNFEATTLEGHAARARSYLLWMNTDVDTLLDSADDGERMLGALLIDVVGEGAAS